MKPLPILAASLFSFLFFAACETSGTVDPCKGGAFADAGSLAMVTSPAPGDNFPSGSVVRGCGRAFEGTLQFKLLARDGSVLASGFTNAGGVDGPAPFSFEVNYSVGSAQTGHLEVYEEDVSDGEGFPPARSVVPVRLLP